MNVSIYAIASMFMDAIARVERVFCANLLHAAETSSQHNACTRLSAGLHNCLKPVAAEDELAVVDQLDYLGADDEDEKRERQFWKSVTINPPYYGADTP